MTVVKTRVTREPRCERLADSEVERTANQTERTTSSDLPQVCLCTVIHI
jgi:hypothetical protein